MLGMSDIGTLDILTINCNTINTQDADRADKCSTNMTSSQVSRCEQYYTNLIQEVDRCKKCYKNIDSNSKSDNKDKQIVIDNENSKVNYFLPGPNQDNDNRVITEITQLLQRDFKDVFTWIGCFDGTFSLQVKPDSKPYQAPLRHVAYALQKPFKEESQLLQQQEIVTPLDVDGTAEWCISFVLVLKPNEKVRLCPDPVRINQALIRPVHRGSTLNGIFQKLNNAKYLSLIDVSSGYHNLKLCEKSLYHTISAYQFGITDTRDCHLGPPPQGICLKENTWSI